MKILYMNSHTNKDLFSERAAQYTTFFNTPTFLQRAWHTYDGVWSAYS